MTKTSYTLLFCILFIFAVSGTSLFKAQLRKTTKLYVLSDNTSLYLPEAKYVRLVTFGFEKLAADIFWFKAINYFGKQISQRKSIPLFSHMCDLVTDLNPTGRHYYDFCSSLISWIAKEPKKSVKLLNRAIAFEPGYWRYYYLRGFNYWYFLENNQKAKINFLIGSKLPDAPAFMTNLATRLIASEEDPSQAISFLQNMIENTNDEKAKLALIENQKLAIISRDLKYLSQAMNKYESLTGLKLLSLQELVDKKLIAYIPKDPYGEPYYLNENYEMLSKQGGKGLKFHGKTAKTGLAKYEQ